jgi:rhamnosyltransferase subunit B
MRVLLFPVGSAGDVHPFIGIGRRLRDRGHDVTLVGNAQFASVVHRAGLKFVETESDQVFQEVLNDADAWHPIRSFKVLFGKPFVKESIRRHYAYIAEHYVPGETVVVCGALSFGARIARDKLAVPLVTVHLQPAMFMSVERPAVYACVGIKSWWPRWLKRVTFWIGDRWLVDPILGPAVNDVRSELGLPPVKHILTTWLHSPDRVIAVFPDWFALPASDWPPQIRLTGFPLYDRGDVAPLAPEVREFLDSGPPPVVVTFGSAMRFAGPYFAAATDALKQLGRRGLFLTPYREQIPADLPPGVAHFDYVPLGQLLPRAAGIVHHGGIGTASQGLASGVPQLVMPLAHDQPDNSARLQVLGVGRELRPKRFTAANVARELTALDSDAVRQACQEVATRFRGTDPLGQTCELIEEVGKTAP